MRATSESRTTSPFEPGFQHDIADSPPCAGALRVDRIRKSLPPSIGSAPSLTGRDLDVLLLDGAHHVPAVITARSDLVRTEPDAHRIVAAAEHPYLADAGKCARAGP